MRLLRLTLEETDPARDVRYRAERVITERELKSYRDFASLIPVIIGDLFKMLDKEMEKHNDTNKQV